ncbi:endoplasmic reticulum resident protein 27 isoform X1 [Astyanax mexicanus]|uniref:endoplasmic reticulum resident protein 27 isoform X1 n=1 Tax=Astyanax mexicanus TaxID=7994 RepID=UPI0020CB06F8|nr:endoplasmic reticulum resident protein 27 isoform X1 [Astyanax mexicanus]
MCLFLLFSLLATCCFAEDKVSTDSALPRLANVAAAEAFIDSAEVVIIGFFKTDEGHGYKEFLAAVEEMKTLPAALCSVKEVWANYSIESDTIALFRKADKHQENLLLEKIKKLDTDGLVRFFTINNIRYITEYNQASAVGLFQSEVKVHLLLFANRGSADYKPLQEKLAALAPHYTGKMLFVLINGKVKSNERALGYFNLKPGDLPRVGIYDADSDKTFLLPEGEISTERVQNFCDSFISGELQKEKESEENKKKSEL